MIPTLLAARAGNYPERECRQCGELLRPKLINPGTGSESLETPGNFRRRQFCSTECFARSRRTAGDEHVVISAHVRRALSEWRSIHHVEWPYQASALAQEHYLELLNEYREAVT